MLKFVEKHVKIKVNRLVSKIGSFSINRKGVIT